NPDYLRPYEASDGHNYIATNRLNRTTGKVERVAQLVANATATLRFQDWRLIDETVVRVAKPRLKAVGLLRGAGLEYTIPNGMGKTILSYENMSDMSLATISMDGLRRSDGDRPVFDIANMPLPIIHKDFSFSL